MIGPVTLLRRQGYRLAIRGLQLVNPGDITIRHHWSGQPIRLHSFRHKGFWVHGPRRERPTMIALARLLRFGDVAFDVGGHIGYLAAWMSALVGPMGRVVVFEPGPNNLPYLRTNLATLANCTIMDVALSNRAGIAPFMIEDLTGQNNSLLLDAGHLLATQSSAAVAASTREVQVKTALLDSYVDDCAPPSLVKIDVEGAEFAVLEGATSLLARHAPALVIEISRLADDVLAILHHHGYQILSIESFQDTTLRSMAQAPNGENYLCLHRSHHSDILHCAGLDDFS